MPRSCGLAERGNRLKSRKLDRVERGSGNEFSEDQSTYGTSWSCTASCHLQGAVSLAFLMTRSADTCAKGEPTGKDGEDVWNRGHIDPAFVVFLDAGCALLPVGVRFALIGWPDKQATHLVLRSDLERCESNQQFLVRVDISLLKETLMKCTKRPQLSRVVPELPGISSSQDTSQTSSCPCMSRLRKREL